MAGRRPAIFQKKVVPRAAVAANLHCLRGHPKTMLTRGGR